MTEERIIIVEHCIYCPERRKTEDGITCNNVWYYYNLPPYLSDEHRKKSQKRPLYEVFDKNAYGIPDECPLTTKKMFIDIESGVYDNWDRTHECDYGDEKTACHIWVGELRDNGDAYDFIKNICPKCDKRN